MSDTNVKYTLSLTDLLSGKLDAASNSATKLDGSMASLQNTIGKVGAALGIAFGIQQVKNFAMSVVDAGSQVENAQTGLTTLLKDSAAAKDVIKNTMEDATKTPFAFEGLLSANKALIGANASAGEAHSTVLDLANAIAATGGGDNELQRMVVNLQQIRNTGKATALDIKQFAYAGINVYQLLADATGKPIDKVKDMEVSYDMLRFALKKAHDQGGLYANGLENMAGNTSVQISNLGDALFQLKVRMFEDLKPAIHDILTAGQNFIKWLGDAWEWTKRNKDMIFALGKGVLAGVIAFKAFKLAMQASVLWTKIQYASITLLGDGFLTAGAGTKFFAGTLQMLRTAMLTNPIGLLAVAVGGLAVAFSLMSDSTDKATTSLDNFNVSLMKTDLYIDKVQGKLSKGIYTDQSAMIDKMSFDELSKYSTDMLDRQKEISAKIAENEATITNLIRSGNSMANLQKERELEEANRMLTANLTNLKDARAKAEQRLKTMPKPTLTNTTLDATMKQTAKVTGNRSINIKIDIGNLVNELNIKTTTITESAGKIKELVTQALLSAVNDSQIVAGQ
jgi:tape measure domain-containing protein